MAAALLMMNMHGAVCASDRDRTIFRYSDKIPFAIMVDPTSELQWEDIMIEYQSKNTISNKMLFEDCAKDFRSFLEERLKQEGINKLKKENNKKAICVGYDPDYLFPRAAILSFVVTNKNMMVYNDPKEISPHDSVFHMHFGNCPNIRILLGGMSEDIVEKTKKYLVLKLEDIMGNKAAAIGLAERYSDVIDEEFDNLQNDPKVTSAISDFTIKDMVSMAENLIETEGLLSSDDPAISPTREIGIVTLAEGFVWIKHSLFGA